MKAPLQPAKSFSSVAAVQRVDNKGIKTITDNRLKAGIQHKLQTAISNSPMQIAQRQSMVLPISKTINPPSQKTSSPKPIQRQIVSVKLGDDLKWYDNESFKPTFFNTREEAETDRILRPISRCPVPRPTAPIKLFDMHSDQPTSGFGELRRHYIGAEAPESLLKLMFENANGQREAFQTTDPKKLAEELYGRTDEERMNFLLLASEKAEITESIKKAATLEEAEDAFAKMADTDKRKAIEEALTMKALSQRNPNVRNIRRPPAEIAGKYDYLIDLPEHIGVPVDPKTVAPYIAAHWKSNKLSKAQQNQAKADKERNVDPNMLLNIALGIASRRGIDEPLNYAKWLVSNGGAQMHELCEVHNSEEYKFKGIVVANVAYIEWFQQEDLQKYRSHPQVLEYFYLKESDLERIIEVAPLIKKVQQVK